MSDDERLLEFLHQCEDAYRRLQRRGQNLWPDSTDLENMVDSDESE